MEQTSALPKPELLKLDQLRLMGKEKGIAFFCYVLTDKDGKEHFAPFYIQDIYEKGLIKDFQRKRINKKLFEEVANAPALGIPTQFPK